MCFARELYISNIVVLERPIRKGIRILEFKYLKNHVFQIYSNSNIRLFFECIRIRAIEIWEHSKPLEYSRKFREHSYIKQVIQSLRRHEYLRNCNNQEITADT